MKIYRRKNPIHSNDEGSTFSLDGSGGEREVSDIWMPMAETRMKGIFNRFMACCCA